MPAPELVDKNHLSDGKLLTDEQKQIVRDFFAKNPTAVLYTGETALPFPVAKSKEGKIFVLYAEPKHLHYTPAETSKLAFQDPALQGIKPLGGGASAVVVLAQNLEDNEWAAAKFQTTFKLDESIRKETEREQRVLERMNLLKGSATIEQVKLASDLTSDFVTTMTVMELAAGKKLEDVIENDKSKAPDQQLPLERRLNNLIKVAKKTDALAQKGLVQCDFNPKNIMVAMGASLDGSEDEVNLIDFGEVYELNEKGEFIPEDKIPETPGFGAPEIAQGGYLTQKRCYSENTMAYSLGKTLSAFLDKNAESNQNIIQKAMKDVAEKLSHEDPNQRISPALAGEEFSLIKDYEQYLKKLGQLDSYKDSTSLLDHMRKTKNSHNSADLEALEKRGVELQRKQSVYQHRLLDKRLNNYISRLDVNKPKAKSHIKAMKGLQKKIQKLDPTAENFAEKLDALRITAYQRQATFEGKKIEFKSTTKEKTRRASGNMIDRTVKWFKDVISPSLSRSTSFSDDYGKLSRSDSTLSNASLTNLPRSPSSTSSTVSSPRSVNSLSSSTSTLDFNDNPLYSVDPEPLVLSKQAGKPLISSASMPTMPTTKPPKIAKSSTSPTLTSNSAFSPAFKRELEKKLAETQAKVAVSPKTSPDNSPTKSPKSKRGSGG